MNHSKNELVLKDLLFVYLKYYIPLTIGFILKQFRLIPDTKPVQILLGISVAYAVIGSYRDLILKSYTSRFNSFFNPNVEDYNLTLLAKKTKDLYEKNPCMPILNEFLLKEFSYFRLKRIEKKNPRFDRFITQYDKIYEISMEGAQRILLGECKFSFSDVKEPVAIDFNFNTLIPYMKTFIELYRDMYKKGYAKKCNVGVMYFRDFIVTWLSDHLYLNETLLEDGEFFIRKDVQANE